jgi:hypothetical protein
MALASTPLYRSIPALSLTPFFSERSIGLCDRALSEPEAAPGEAAVPVLQDESAGELCAVQDDF